MKPVPKEAIEAARGYEDSLVPALFRQWPQHVLEAAGVRQGAHVLDVACGTGILAREAAGFVGASGRVVGVDPSPGMLAVAAELENAIEWRSGTAESLPVEDAEFDATLSQFGLMFFPDRLASIREMFRATKSGGCTAVAVWDSLEHNRAYEIESQLIERLAGETAANAVRAPFVLGELSEITTLFEKAGYQDLRAETKAGVGRFPSVVHMLEADLRGWLPVLGITLDEPTIEQIIGESKTVLSEYIRADGSVEFPVSAHIVCGSRG